MYFAFSSTVPLGRYFVGGGPSGRDIAEDMRTVAELIVHSGEEVPASKERIVGRPRVVAFEADGVVRFSDGSVERDVDHCVLATGYEMWFPFLPEEILHAGGPPSHSALPGSLYNSTHHVFPLARHIWIVFTNGLREGYKSKLCYVISLNWAGVLLRRQPKTPSNRCRNLGRGAQ